MKGACGRKRVRRHRTGRQASGLIGCGRIGGEVAKRAMPGMDVVFFRRTQSEMAYAKQVLLDELIRTADYISLHVPLSDATRNILNAEAFAQ